jgi:hypothetical protein
MLITPKQFAEDVLQMLHDSVAKEYPEATEEEIQQHMITIANAMSTGFFTMKMEM